MLGQMCIAYIACVAVGSKEDLGMVNRRAHERAAVRALMSSMLRTKTKPLCYELNLYATN